MADGMGRSSDGRIARHSDLTVAELQRMSPAEREAQGAYPDRTEPRARDK